MNQTAAIISFPQRATVNVPIVNNHTDLDPKRHNPVEPIRRVADIQQIKYYILHRHTHRNANLRDYAYIMLSLNTARRAGDIVTLHIGDVLNEDGTFKEYVKFSHEQKTGKRSKIILVRPVIDALALYLNSFTSINLDDWLFPNTYDKSKHITVDAMRLMLKRTAAALNMDIHIGTHTLRKTTAYHMLNNSKDVIDETMISQFLNHSDIQTTYAYMGREQDEMDKFVKSRTLTLF